MINELKSGVGKSEMPSKTWSILACETPIISCFALDGELSILIVNNKVGLTGEAENAEKLSNNITYLQINT